jgi:hypothetical protein
MNDTYAGQRRIKEKGETYLPPTSGMVHDGMENEQPGKKAYDAYRLRAVFHDFVREAVENLLGMMHHKPPEEISLPPGMEPLRERLSARGESLMQLLHRINMNQLLKGRLGLLVDLPAVPSPSSRPYIALYEAESIINWDDGQREELTEQVLNLVVLNESENVRRTNFEWEFEEKYRVLTLGDILQNERSGVYRFGVYVDLETGFQYSEDLMRAPVLLGRELDFIPFTFVNTLDLDPEPDKPPLLGLAELALTIYRGEADYRQALFMQGQDTLVVKGAGGVDETEGQQRVGAGAVLYLSTEGDAYYVGVESGGLEEMRIALTNDKTKAGATGGMLLDTLSRERESGDSLTTRLNARTASLKEIAQTGAAGLERALRQIAVWMGEDPRQVIIRPNLDFGAPPLTTQSIVEITSARNQGAPLSAASLHEILSRNGYTQRSFREELEAISSEFDGPLAQLMMMGSGDLNPANDGRGQRRQDREDE